MAVNARNFTLGLNGGSDKSARQAAFEQMLGISGFSGAWDTGDASSLSQLLAGTTAPVANAALGTMLDIKPAGGRTMATYIASQAELLPGGTFDTQADVDAWTIVIPASMTKSLVGGKMRLVATGTTQCYRTFTTVVGAWYRVTGAMTDVSVVGNPFRAFRKADNSTASVNAVALGSGNSGFNTPSYFRATATTTYIIAQVNIITGGDVNTVDVDDISVKLVGTTALPLIAPATGQRPLLRAQPYADFDGVNDVLNVQVTTNLGSTCAIYYRTAAGTDSWVTGQTVSTPTFGLSTTDWTCAALFTSDPSASDKLLVQAWGAAPRIPFSSVLVLGDSFATTNLTAALTALSPTSGFILDGVGGTTLQQQAVRLEAYPQPVRSHLLVVDGANGNNQADTLDALARMKACLAPGYRMVYMEPSPQFDNLGTPARDTLLAINAAVAAAAPSAGYTYAPNLADIQSRGDGGGTDASYIANGLWPLSLMLSAVDFHPNTTPNSAGWTGVTAYAKSAYDALKAQGMLP